MQYRMLWRDSVNARKFQKHLLTRTAKDGDRELSRFDLNSSSVSAEELVLEQEDCCTLDEAVERLEAIRYSYGFDLTPERFIERRRN